MNARIDLSLSRREFLKASGALVVSAAGPRFIGEALAQTAGAKPPLVPTELDSWVAILPDGRVTAFFGKMDMGQSLDIAIAQIVADELDVDVARVDVVMGDTALTCKRRPKHAGCCCNRLRRNSGFRSSSCASTTAW